METPQKNQPIKQWAEDDRPREKLLLKGKSALSTAELMAILIGSGNSKKSALQLAQEILDSADNSLIELSKMSVKELMRFKGMGPAKAVSIVAGLELGKRRLSEKAKRKKTIKSGEDVYKYLISELTDSYYEKFYVLMLDVKNTVLKKMLVSSGGLTQSVVDVKKIFKEAIAFNATSIILAHNHPSNNKNPSENDINLTHKLVKAGELLNIRVLDHVIFGNDGYYSFVDNGIMKETL
jgi:DNA repair protein RadC